MDGAAFRRGRAVDRAAPLTRDFSSSVTTLSGSGSLAIEAPSRTFPTACGVSSGPRYVGLAVPLPGSPSASAAEPPADEGHGDSPTLAR